LALFQGETCVAEENVPAPAGGAALWDQLPGRLASVNDFVNRQGDVELDAVVGRGGLIRPVPSGTILVNDAMIADARAGYQGEHPSNLGCALADAVARPRGIPAYIVDPVAVDEMSPLARYSGTPVRRANKSARDSPTAGGWWCTWAAASRWSRSTAAASSTPTTPTPRGPSPPPAPAAFLPRAL